MMRSTLAAVLVSLGAFANADDLVTTCSDSADPTVTSDISSQCFDDNKCASFLLQTSALESDITAEALFDSNGNVTLGMYVRTTGSSDLNNVRLITSCYTFEVDTATATCEEENVDGTSTGDDPCADVLYLSVNVNPSHIEGECGADITTVTTETDGREVVQVDIKVDIDLGDLSTDDEFTEVGHFKHCVTYLIDVTDKAVILTTSEGLSTDETADKLELGVVAYRVPTVNSGGGCDTTTVEADAVTGDIYANDRICVLVDTDPTKEDSAGFAAVIREASMYRYTDNTYSTVDDTQSLVVNRRLSEDDYTMDSKYFGSFFCDEYEDTSDLAATSKDYFTFFIDPDMYRDVVEGGEIFFKIEMVVEFHKAGGGGGGGGGDRRLTRKVFQHMEVTKPAAAEDGAVRLLQAAEDDISDAAATTVGATKPVPAPPGIASVSLTVDVILDEAVTAGLAELLHATATAAAGVVAGDQVEVVSVETAPNGAAVSTTVHIAISGIDDLASETLAASLANDVEGGSFYYRLLSNQAALPLRDVRLVDSSAHFVTRVQGPTLARVESAVVVRGVDAATFNADAELKNDFKQIVAAAAASLVADASEVGQPVASAIPTSPGETKLTFSLDSAANQVAYLDGFRAELLRSIGNNLVSALVYSKWGNEIALNQDMSASAVQLDTVVRPAGGDCADSNGGGGGDDDDDDDSALMLPMIIVSVAVVFAAMLMVGAYTWIKYLSVVTDVPPQDVRILNDVPKAANDNAEA